MAVRHADDHIHIASTLVRQDGRRPRRDHDIRAVQREARKIEADLDLRRLNAGDGTAAKRPTSREHFKAKRQGQDTTTREILRMRVRQAVSAASSEAEFFALLDILGYSVSLPGDLNKHGEPVWFSGSTLAGDLSLPKIRHRITNTGPELVTARPADRWHQAAAATERIPHHLTHSGDDTAQGQLVALGGALDLLPLIAPATVRTELERAAALFERATRSRIAADLDSARVLRNSIQTILRTPAAARDGAGLVMLLDAALIAVAFARHWHRTHQHSQQEAAAQQALVQLQTAYARVAVPVLDDLARRAPSDQTQQRYARHLRQAAPDHAELILQDPAWDALATVLADAEAAGHNPTIVLDRALGQRALDGSRNPARTLTWRVHRLGQRHTPGLRAQAAMARSTTRVPTVTSRPAAATPAASQQQPPRKRRR